MNARAKSTLLDSWNRYLDDLDRCAATPMPMESQGKLVRVAGLVLEAAGLRLPVGAVCEIHSESRVEKTPVLGEVVGFAGDRAYLMPTAEVHGLSSGARVVPVSTPVNPPKLGQVNHPWRRSEDRTRHMPIGDGLLGRVVNAQGEPMDRKGPLRDVRSEPLVRRAINAMDRDPVRQSLGAALFLAGRYDEASQSFRDALVQSPQNGWALYGLMRSEQALGRAVGFFREALKEDAGFARAQAGICRAEIHRFETARDAPAFNRASNACDRAARMDPELMEVSLAMGDLDRVRGEYPQAIEHYTRALQDVALRPDAYIGLAATQAALGNNPLALDYYERAHQLRPGDATIHSELGYHHYLNGNLDKAVASYRVATTLQPDRATLWSSLGGVYYVAGRRREAAEAYSRSLAIEPTYGALSNFASLRFEDGAYAEAADLYRRAAQLDPIVALRSL